MTFICIICFYIPFMSLIIKYIALIGNVFSKLKRSPISNVKVNFKGTLKGLIFLGFSSYLLFIRLCSCSPVCICNLIPLITWDASRFNMSFVQTFLQHFSCIWGLIWCNSCVLRLGHWTVQRRNFEPLSGGSGSHLMNCTLANVRNITYPE